MIGSEERETVEILRGLAAEGPDPERITRLALADAQPPHRRRVIPLPLAVAAAAVLAAVGAWSLIYFVPVTESGAAAAGPTSIQAQWLDRVGLTSTDLTQTGATMVSSGLSVRVDGVYADAIRTVVVMHSTGALLDPASVSMTDQFGRRYTVLDAVGDSQTGLQTMTFGAFEAPASKLGARLHLEATRTMGDQPLSGSWTLDAVVLPKSGESLSAVGGSLSSWNATFESIVRSGSSLSVTLRLDGPPIDLITPGAGGGKPQPNLVLDLAGPSDTIQTAEVAVTTSGSSTYVTALWVGVSSGHYRIEVTTSGATLTSALQIN